MLRTGARPLPFSQTVELMAVIIAGLRSREQGGRTVMLREIYDELDGSFPNHEANPLDVETLEALQHLVRKGGFDFGIAFDH